MTISQLQAVLAEYTDRYIAMQHPAEQQALRIERAELSYLLSCKLAERSRVRLTAIPDMVLS